MNHGVTEDTEKTREKKRRKRRTRRGVLTFNELLPHGFHFSMSFVAPGLLALTGFP